MNPINIVDPLDYPGWDNLLLTHPDNSIFHTSAWAKVLHESYGYKSLYFVSTKDGSLETLIPMMGVKSFITGKRGVSLPFTDFCPLISPDTESFQNVINRVKEYGQKAGWKFIEFRGGENYFGNEPTSSVYYTHDLDLTQSEGAILSTFRNSTRRNIKRAIKKNVEVRILNDLDSVKEFYRLNCMTRKRHGLPPQPYSFFRRIHDYIVSKKKGMVVLAFTQAKVIAGAVCFCFGKKSNYKYGASDVKYQHLRANNLVMWEAIRWCIENGFEIFSFGRTEPEHAGLLQFKRGWGTTEEAVKYFRYDLSKSIFVQKPRALKSSYGLFKRLPLPLSSLTGSVLYKHVG